MINMAIVAIYAPFALITAVVFVIELLRRFKRQEDYLFTLLCFCAVCWFASDIAGILTGNVEVAKFFINFILIFVGFIPPLLLLFVLKFYKVPYKPSAVVLVLLFIIPAVNTVMALTAGYHTLVNARLEIVSLAPFREVVIVWGTWFWIHTAYCYVVSITLISVIMIRHFHMPRFYRLPSTLMVVGVSITLLGNVMTLLQVVPAAMDPTLITMSISLIFFDLAIINNNKSKFVRFSQGHIYHYLDEYILILDEHGRVVDSNRPALVWFSTQGITLNSATLEDITEALLREENSTQKALEDEKGIDYYIIEGGFPMVLNLRTHEMTDAHGDIIGSLAVFSDVTQNRILIQRLEEKAGVDSLTGLANRMAFDGAKKRLDTSGYLPLSIIMCDANGLKSVNDTLGHQYGDMLLMSIAGVLEKACPKPGFVARIGGDEFIYLLPHTGPEASHALMEKIKKALSGLENLPFTASVAMGMATKHSAKDCLADVIALADSKMYENKRQMKEKLESKAIIFM